MFVFISVNLLFSVTSCSGDTGASVKSPFCRNNFCISLIESEITAEAGLCVVIPCLFTSAHDFTPQNIVWFKCEPFKKKCTEPDMIFHTNKNRKVNSGFRERVSLLEPDLSQNNCSIIINDLKESDSGYYQLRVNGLISGKQDGFTFSPKAAVAVKALSQKPTVMIPPLIEGHQATLTCTAPGLCSGSVPEITWTWRGAGVNDSHITGNITDFKTENLTAVTQRHSSTLTFDPSAEHRGTEVTCKVRFTGNRKTEETVTLNVTCPVQHCRSFSAVLPWGITGVSLSVNVFSITYIIFLCCARKTVKLKQEDRIYTSLKKTDLSPDYDVIAQPLN